jgi:hypothetical protein
MRAYYIAWGGVYTHKEHKGYVMFSICSRFCSLDLLGSEHTSHHLNLNNLKKGNAERSTDFLEIFLVIPLQKNFASLVYIYMPMTYTDQKYKAC